MSNDEGLKNWLEEIHNLHSRRINKKKGSLRNVILLLASVFFILSISFYINQNSKNELIKNGKTTRGIITNIDLRYEKVNDMDGTTILNYTIYYKFSHQRETYDGVHIVDRYHYNQYFKEKIGINDSITVLYNPKKPKQNIIKNN